MASEVTRSRTVQCEGKSAFETWTQAARRVRVWRLHKRYEYRDEGVVPQPYRCPHCGRYHIGNLWRRRDGVAYRREHQEGIDYDD